MKFDFENMLDRCGRDARSINEIGCEGAPTRPKKGFDLIPMWVADQNFAVAPSIKYKIQERLDFPSYAYFAPSQEYFDAIVNWHKESFEARNIAVDCISFHNSVLGGVITSLNVLCSRGDKVLIHIPIYNGYIKTLKNNGYHIVYSPLFLDEKMVWRMDFKAMEQLIIEHDIHVAILCSPHNPTGRVWEKDELEKAYKLFEKYEVYVISDEIWADLLIGDLNHVPSQELSSDASQRTIALYSPTKTFNIAGITGAYSIIQNKKLQKRIEKEASLTKYNIQHIFSSYALEGAYSKEGREWKNQLCDVLRENMEYARLYISERFYGVTLAAFPQASYILFINCTEWLNKNEKTIDELMQKCWDVGVALQDGRVYHAPNYLRINLALPQKVLMEALYRLDRFVFNFK